MNGSGLSWSTLIHLLGTLITAPAQIQISRPTSDQPLSTASLVLLQSWLSECCASHIMCGTSLSLDRMRGRSPTRLVDVLFEEAGRVKLVETQGQRLNYAAMSYCWGAHHAGKKTTPGTIAEMKRGIQPGELTRTIQDAITVVRALQIRYLWVDALCIIQGDDADWQREASMMGMIYANADFTIAATRAMASSEGFLQSRAEHTAAFTLPGSATTIVFRESLDTAEDYLEQVYDSPLLARAWVMQERALSRRTVDFTTKKMFLACRQGILTEDGVRTTHHETASSNFTKILDLLCMPSLTDAVRDIWTNQFFSVWAELIQWYMTREITHTKDRLPAVAGMANLASTVLPGRYLHGLWEINLADGLFWQPLHRPMVQDPNGEAPSWSWASAASEVILSGHNPNESLITFIALNDCQRMLTIKGRIQKCLVSLLANAPESPCRSERKLRDPPIAKDFYTFHLRSAVGPRVVGSTLNNVCLFDRIRGDRTDFYYVDLSVSHQGTTTWRGLLLQKPANGEDSSSYSRIGVCWSDDRSGHRVRPTAFSIL